MSQLRFHEMTLTGADSLGSILFHAVPRITFRNRPAGF